MNCKVLARYVDKVTKQKMNVGDIIEVSVERFAEINATSHGAFLEEIREAPEPSTYSDAQLELKKPPARTKKKVNDG